MQVVLTALVTVFVGGLSFSLGQVLVRGMIEPGLELKRTIGEIAHDLDFYANRIFDESSRADFNRIFRGHWAHLYEHLYMITGYSIFSILFRLPPAKDVKQAAQLLLGHANAPIEADPRWWRDESNTIRRLLRIRK